MSGLLRDLRFGARLLARSPVFTASAVLLLAVGIGANTLIFSVTGSGVAVGLCAYAAAAVWIRTVLYDLHSWEPMVVGEYAAIVDAPQIFSFSPEHCRVIGEDHPMALYQDQTGEGILVPMRELDQNEASGCRQTRDQPAIGDLPAARSDKPAPNVHGAFAGPVRQLRWKQGRR